MSGRLPTFLIIGAPKSGTTSLAAYLAEHPDVFMAPQKEVHFFDQFFNKGVEWYRDQFRDSANEHAVGEASPTYLDSPRAMTRMAQILPDAKLVAVLRNPVDQAYSHYWWKRVLFERRSFDEAVRAEMRGEEVPRQHRYLESASYLRQLQRACDHYPRERLQVLILDDLHTKPTETVAAVYGFIGVDDAFEPSNAGAVLNPAYRLRSERLRHVLHSWHLYRRLPFSLGLRIDKLNRVPFRYPQMDPAVRAELVEWFAEERAALEVWLGRDLSFWAA